MLEIGQSKNTLSATLKKMGHVDKTITFSVLTIVMILICDFLVRLWQELGRPVLIDGVFGLTQIVK